MISSRLTAWENLLDSVSHIGPLTNNPSEAKRLQVIRPDQNTPRVQMLGTKIDRIITAGSHKKNNRKRKGQSKNKTTKKKNRKQTTTAAKTGKRKNVNSSTKQFKYKDELKQDNLNENRRKVRIMLTALTLTSNIFPIKSYFIPYINNRNFSFITNLG